MAVNVVLNGTTYSIPEPGDTAWGQNLTDYFVAQASGLLQKAGGSFFLTAEVDFGASFGLKSLYYKSRTTNPATSGQIRLANTDTISWRNAANSANLPLTVDSGNYLTYNGVEIFSSAGRLGANAVPAFTGGDVTSAGSSLVLSIGAGRVTNTMLAGSITASKLVGTDIATVGTLTAGATGAGFTIALSTSTVTGTLADARLPTSMATKTFTGVTTFPGSTSIDGSGNALVGGTLGVTGLLTAVAANFSGTINISGLTASLPVQTDASKNLVSAAIDLSGTQATGTLAAARFPALSGDISNSAGSLTTAIGAGKVTNTMLAGSIAYSKLSLTGAILNADLAGSIAYSKLVLTGAILNADLAGSIAYSKLSLTGSILNADLAGSIAASKLVGSDIATVGTITSGTWNAGAVTSSGALTLTTKASINSVSGTVTGTGSAGTLSRFSATESTSTTLNSASTSAGDTCTYGSIAGVNGLLFVSDQSSGPGAFWALTGATPTFTAITVDSEFTNTSGTNSKVNVYKDGGGLLTIQNFTGANKSFKITLFRLG
jgi:hypothetical protein